MVPIHINTIPTRMRARSKALVRRFLSLKMMAAHVNDIITELLLTRETTEIIESGSFKDVKYAKSPMQMNIDIKGIAQLQRNGVVWCLFGYQSNPQITHMMIIW